MKKWIVLTLSLLLLVIAAVPVLAAEETVITVTANKSVLERGDTVTFTVSISGNVPWTSVASSLDFDSRYFEFVSSEEKTDLGGAVLVPYSTKEKEIGLLRIGGAGTFSGVMQTITFRVKADAPINAVSITGAASGQNTGAPITVQFKGVSISVHCAHSFGDWTKVDDKTCKHTCTKCGTPEEEAHDWNVTPGNPAPSCESAGVMVYTCLHCGTVKQENAKPLGHKWKNACDTTCENGCGTTREAPHNYGKEWVKDATGHWHECVDCHTKKDFTSHTPGAAATETTAQTCTVCKYEINPALGHVHQVSTAWISDGESHWHRCEKKNCLYRENEAEHDYDDDCDMDCNTCGYVRVPPHNYAPEWQANASGHWHLCTLCGAKSEVLEHIPGPEATETDPQICEECNYRINMPLSHVHDYGDVWYSDDSCHWQSCKECNGSTQMEPHDWDEGTVQEDGSILYTCTICKKQLTRSEPMPTQPTTVPSSTSSTTPTDNRSDGFRIPWKWAGGAAAVLLVVAVILIIVELIRSRKKNMRGRFSKE